MRLAGLVLAGGAGSRMGGRVPKPLLAIGSTTPLAEAIARLAPQCDPVLISTNDAAAFAGFEHRLLPDRRSERLGPLAGLEAAAVYLKEIGAEATHLVSASGDTPFLPADLVPRLAERARASVVVASSRGRVHPTVALWPLKGLAGLTAELDDPDGKRSLMWLLESNGFELVDFEPDPSAPDVDPFFNINTPGDLEKARRHLG